MRDVTLKLNTSKILNLKVSGNCVAKKTSSLPWYLRFRRRQKQYKLMMSTITNNPKIIASTIGGMRSSDSFDTGEAPGIPKKN